MLKIFWGRPPRPPPARGGLTLSHTLPQQLLRRCLVGCADSFQSPSWLDSPFPKSWIRPCGSDILPPTMAHIKESPCSRQPSLPDTGYRVPLWSRECITRRNDVAHRRPRLEPATFVSQVERSNKEFTPWLELLRHHARAKETRKHFVLGPNKVCCSLFELLPSGRRYRAILRPKLAGLGLASFLRLFASSSPFLLLFRYMSVL